MSELEIRHTVESLFSLKVKILGDTRSIQELDAGIAKALEPMRGTPPLKVERNRDTSLADNWAEKHTDRILWRFLAKLYELDKYMLATKHKDLLEEIESFKTPAFTVENVTGWLDGLQDLLRENVQTLVHQVFREITDGTYFVGGYRGEQKKRNNNGIDANFILYTHDERAIAQYSYSGLHPTITDDLEKACYLLDGKTMPKTTLKDQMRLEKTNEARNEYLTVKVCQNGNTHYKLCEETREKLNRYGPEGAVIGENIKIKIVKAGWGAA